MHKKSYLVVVVLVVEIDVCFPFHSMFVRFSPRTLFVSGSKFDLITQPFIWVNRESVNSRWIVKILLDYLGIKAHKPTFPLVKTIKTRTPTNSFSYPIASMYGIFTYIHHKNQPINVGKYTSPTDVIRYENVRCVFLCAWWMKLSRSAASRRAICFSSSASGCCSPQNGDLYT